MQLYDIYEDNATNVLVDQYGWSKENIEFLKQELDIKGFSYLIGETNKTKESPLLIFSNYEKLLNNYYQYKETKVSQTEKDSNISSYKLNKKQSSIGKNIKTKDYETINFLKMKKFWGKNEFYSFLKSNGVDKEVDKATLSEAGYKEMTAYFISKKWSVVEEIDFCVKGLRDDVIWDIKKLYTEDLVTSIRYHIKNVESIETISKDSFLIKTNKYFVEIFDKLKNSFSQKIKEGAFVWEEFYKYFEFIDIPKHFYESVGFPHILNKLKKVDGDLKDFNIYSLGDKWIILNNTEYISLKTYLLDKWDKFRNNIPLPTPNDLDDFVISIEKEFNVELSPTEKEDIISMAIYKEQEWI